MAKRKHGKGAISYAFVPVPKALLTSQEWAALSHRARVLAFDLMAQHSGKNNGRLSPSWEAMRRCGWTSKDQLAKAKAELLLTTFTIETRKGHPPRTAAWIGFTFWKLDFDPSMDVRPEAWPIYAPLKDPNEGRDQAVKNSLRTPPHGPMNGLRPPHGGPMESRK